MNVLTFPMTVPADANRVHSDRDQPSPHLIERAVQGDAQASRALWNHYAPPVRRFVRRMMGPDFDPSDIIQEIFLGVFAGLVRLRQRDSLRSFVFAVAANQVRLEIRRRRWRRLLFRSDDPLENQSAQESASDTGDQDSLVAARRLYGVLSKLSVRDREVVVLRFMEGLTLPEVAAQTGCSLATAKRRLTNAAQSLAQLAAADPFLCAYMTGSQGVGHG